MLADAQATASDEQKPVTARSAAIRSLKFARFADVQAQLIALLAPRQAPQVQSSPVETLACFEDGQVAAILLGAWPGMSPGLRATATEATSPGAQRRTNRNLLLAHRRSDKKQVGNVRTRDEHDNAHGGEQGQQRRPNVADDILQKLHHLGGLIRTL